MRTRLLVLPALSLAGAALLFSPLRSTQAFSKNGGSLSESQRDFRVYDNFADSTADDNTVPTLMFPGALGLELAIWKGAAEWNSELHGTGTSIGSGGANFDAMWSGRAGQVGNSNHNIASAISSCSMSTLAYTELPVSDGWRIRFCDNWTWEDGPGSVGNRFDIQGVMAHEYGHALGLGHSTDTSATMYLAVGAGDTSLRSIEADDIDGVQCIYGVAVGTKPSIDGTAADTGTNTLTIYGTNFGATNNEIWLTPQAATGTTVDPIVRVPGVSSSGGGTQIVITIPAAAGPGSVIVNKSAVGNGTVSNAFPTDLVGTFGTVPEPDITGVSPSTIPCLIPGTDETITITGTDLDLATAVLLDGVPISPSRYTVVSDTTITLDMPQASSLGLHDLGVTNGAATDEFPVTIVAPAAPRLEWGTGDPLNVVDRDGGLDMILAGQPGALQVVRGSPMGPPTFNSHIRPIDMVLVDAGSYVIPAEGWLSVHLGDLPHPAVVGGTWYAKSFHILLPKPFPASNDQSITLVP
jgi:hypothetical protein